MIRYAEPEDAMGMGTVYCRARAFYERMGMRENGKRRSISIAGADVWEVQYEKQLSGAENE